ncbi:hypothetical protein O181_081939 [Austropuccinia psidii MF-1]|uniref:Uncharacterized protein n=1 Tax=Austropuccinia psidii MF-1 TaxID=1389203 RepID=A0A9Q3FNS1_9BASI|nr:hypothetical protein [Austropuccinia psidii MF-1]
MAPSEMPQHQEFAERANCTILKKACCLLGRSSLPAKFCANALNTAVFLSNLFPTALRGGQSPNSLWTNSPARLSRLKMFGCRPIFHNLGLKIKWKLNPPEKSGIFLGYENNNTEYCILRLSNMKVAITQPATFNTNFFPSILQYNRD